MQGAPSCETPRADPVANSAPRGPEVADLGLSGPQKGHRRLTTGGFLRRPSHWAGLAVVAQVPSSWTGAEGGSGFHPSGRERAQRFSYALGADFEAAYFIASQEAYHPPLKQPLQRSSHPLHEQRIKVVRYRTSVGRNSSGTRRKGHGKGAFSQSAPRISGTSCACQSGRRR